MLAQVNVEWLMHFIIQMLSHKMKDNHHLDIYLGNLVNWKKKFDFENLVSFLNQPMLKSGWQVLKFRFCFPHFPCPPLHGPHFPLFSFVDFSFYFLPLILGSPLLPATLLTLPCIFSEVSNLDSDTDCQKHFREQLVP